MTGQDGDLGAVAAEEFRDFEALRAVAREQRGCIDGEDMEGLNRSLARARGLMERIELRQRRHPGCREALRGGEGGWDGRREQLGRLIAEIDALRRDNEAALTHWRERIRVQLGQVGKGTRGAGRGYGRRSVSGPRLLDGVR